MVRLKGIKDLANQFVRVRLWEIESADLNLFQFDYDVTFMIFFLNAEEHVYSRFGGRDAKDAESRMSLASLNYTMQSVLDTHCNSRPRTSESRPKPLRIRELPFARRYGGCIHCHQVKEILTTEAKRAGKWTRDSYWRYPLPENLGLSLEIDRGNITARVTSKSPAAKTGLQVGDKITSIGKIAIHSFGDAQFALDQAPQTGPIKVHWQRDGKINSGDMMLAQGWRRTDLTWRPSLRNSLPSARVYGRDLSESERKTRGLTKSQLAFWQRFPVSDQAKSAGILEEDIILGFDDETLNMKAYDFLQHVRRSYLIGDRVMVNVLRGEKHLRLPMTLR